MFGTKQPAEPAIQLSSLPSGSQYAINVALAASTPMKIAKEINRHLGAHQNHKVVAITAVDKFGAVVVFEVR